MTSTNKIPELGGMLALVLLSRFRCVARIIAQVVLGRGGCSGCGYGADSCCRSSRDRVVFLRAQPLSAGARVLALVLAGFWGCSS